MRPYAGKNSHVGVFVRGQNARVRKSYLLVQVNPESAAQPLVDIISELTLQTRGTERKAQSTLLDPPWLGLGFPRLLVRFTVSVSVKKKRD